MLTAETIQKLKRGNVSVDANLTMQRTKDALKAAKRTEKNEIDALAGVQRVSVNRVYTTGNISAKIAIAIAQILNINPFFLTGEADERGECTDEILSTFLMAKGYADLVEQPAKPARKTRAKKAPAPSTGGTIAPVGETLAPKADESPVPIVESEVPDVKEVITDNHRQSENYRKKILEMTEEEANLLLHSLFVQAKFSLKAQTMLLQVKGLLANDVQ